MSSLDQPKAQRGQHSSYLKVYESRSNEKSSTVNLAVRNFTTFPIDHFSIRHLGRVLSSSEAKFTDLLIGITRTRAKFYFLTLTHMSSGLIVPPLSIVQLVN